MSKKSIRMISTLLTIVMLLIMLAPVAFAAVDVNNLMSGGNDLSNNKIAGLGQDIIDTMTTLGMVIAIVLIMVLGIKYMVGSAEDKSAYKKSMMPYFIGAILLFGAGTVVKFVQAFGTNM